MNANQNDEQELSIIILGPRSSGKSTLLNRFIYDKYNPYILGTINMYSLSKEIIHNNTKQLINVFEIPGDLKESDYCFESLINKIIVLTFDLSEFKSFDSLSNWIDAYKTKLEDIINQNQSKLLIIGNKLDKERLVSEEEGRNLASSINANYFETSAKTGEYFKECFEYLLMQDDNYEGNNTEKNLESHNDNKEENKDNNKEVNKDIKEVNNTASNLSVNLKKEDNEKTLDITTNMTTEVSVVHPTNYDKRIESLEKAIALINKDNSSLRQDYIKMEEDIKNLRNDMDYIDMILKNPNIQLKIEKSPILKGHSRRLTFDKSKYGDVEEDCIEDEVLY